MKGLVALFPIALTLGAAILVPGRGAQAAPTTITACQTISQSGSYVLANDLTSSSDCLVITTSFVTINLAGFSISSSGGAGISAILSTGFLQGIAVRNGSISAFRDGVALSGPDLTDGAEGSIVENLRISATAGDGIRAKGSVRGNTVTGGAPFGTAIRASGVVTDNYVTGGGRGRDGIIATGTVRGNAAVATGGIGITVGVGSTVIGNTATDNFFAGISADCPTNLTDNTAVNNVAGPDLILNGQGCHNEDNVAPKTQP